MRRLQPAVVAEHELLIAPEGRKRIGKAVSLARARLVQIVRQVGPEIDEERHQQEEQAAPQEREQHVLPVGLHALALLRRTGQHRAAPAAARDGEHAPPLQPARDERAEEQHRQPGAGVEARPLARRAEAEEQPRERERPQRFPEPVHKEVHRDVLVHEVVHQQDEEHGVHVDGGDARLREVHEVHRKQRRAEERILALFEQALAEQVQHRQHRHAHERAHDAPAERVHAEDGDAHGDDELAQRRMRVLIRREAVQVLVGRAGMVELVKIHAVVVRRRVRHGVLLVEQGGLRAGGAHDARVDPLARVVEKRDLVEADAAAHILQRKRARGKPRLHAVPAEHVVVELLVLLLVPVVRAQQQRAAVCDVAVHPEFAHGRLLRKLDGHSLAGRLRRPGRFRR